MSINPTTAQLFCKLSNDRLCSEGLNSSGKACKRHVYGRAVWWQGPISYLSHAQVPRPATQLLTVPNQPSHLRTGSGDSAWAPLKLQADNHVCECHRAVRRRAKAQTPKPDAREPRAWLERKFKRGDADIPVKGFRGMTLFLYPCLDMHCCSDVQQLQPPTIAVPTWDFLLPLSFDKISRLL